MRMKKIGINEISFQRKEYSDSLKDSIKRIGLSFPIKVKVEQDKYYCVDGHKRLSVLTDLDMDLETITAIIVNNGDNRSNDCWRGRNSH